MLFSSFNSMIPTANPMDAAKSTTVKDQISSSTPNTPNRSSSRERSNSKSPQPNQSPQKNVQKSNMIVTANNSISFKCNLKCKKSDEETFV